MFCTLEKFILFGSYYSILYVLININRRMHLSKTFISTKDFSSENCIIFYDINYIHSFVLSDFETTNVQLYEKGTSRLHKL